jgi:hypothetical protein
MEIFAAYDWKPFQSCFRYFWVSDIYRYLRKSERKSEKQILLLRFTLTIDRRGMNTGSYWVNDGG